MGVSSKKASRRPVRSVSLPCRSHPNTDRMEKLLNEVNTWESTLSSSNPSADMICSGFSHLTALYECLEDLFNTNNLSQTSSLFGNDSEKKWTDEILDVSVMLLDECSNTSDVTSQTKQLLRDFGCDLRRNGGYSSGSIIAKYTEFRNKLKKEIKRSMSSLKQVENKIRSCPALMVDSENYHQMWVVSVYREVTAFSIVVFRLLLDFLGIPCLRTRPRGRWTMVSRFLSGGGKVVPEDKADTNENEFHRLNAALSSEKQEFIQQAVPKNLEALDAALERVNSHQHSMSRRLIRTRASILNMVSSY
ncbi:hypothetical protein SSX86_011383 [Deinandra increscens subsp. villosa]|uniref:Uncharacterized protein n=1 Tax=Deinandra increscens subsp. villosa TaxID=3103831 RepID=A0AAP0H1X1_9ASTR